LLPNQFLERALMRQAPTAMGAIIRMLISFAALIWRQFVVGMRS
jgi:hypothetical protein